MGNRISKYIKNIDIKKCITTILVLFVILNTFMVYQNKVCRLNEIAINIGENTTERVLNNDYEMEFSTDLKTIRSFKLFLNSKSDEEQKINVSLLDENKNVIASKEVSKSNPLEIRKSNSLNSCFNLILALLE